MGVGLGCQLLTVIKGLNQLKGTYPHSWETYVACSGFQIFLGPRDWTTSDYISWMTGIFEVPSGEKSYAGEGRTNLSSRRRGGAICFPRRSASFPKMRCWFGSAGRAASSARAGVRIMRRDQLNSPGGGQSSIPPARIYELELLCGHRKPIATRASPSVGQHRARRGGTHGIYGRSGNVESAACPQDHRSPYSNPPSPPA